MRILIPWFTVSTVAALHNAHMTSSSKPQGQRVIIPLTNFETSFEIMEVRGTSTITFFITKDIECAFKSIQERFVQIAEFNPWMVGSLESTGIRLNVQPKVVHLSHPPLSDKAEFDAALAKACPAEPLVRDDNGESVKVHPQMSFDDIVETVSLAGGRLDKGSALVDDATKVVSKWTCLSGLDDKSFALIFTMSHVVADGFTYYSILSMLSTDSEVYSLDFTRNADARSRCLQLCGQDEIKFMTSVPQLINWSRRIGCSPREKCSAIFVDKLKVHQAKAAADLTDAVPFVSTNDVLTSTFGKAVNARTLYMAINFRGRLGDDEEENPTRAGNYEGALFLGPKHGFGDPAQIRRKLARGPPFSRPGDVKEIPGPCDSLLSVPAQVTSWNFPCFSGEIRLPGCECKLHLPIPMFDRTPFELAIIFKPAPGKLGMVFASQFSGEELCRSTVPLGDPICPF